MKIIIGVLVVAVLAIGGYWLNPSEQPAFVPVPDNAARKGYIGQPAGLYRRQ